MIIKLLKVHDFSAVLQGDIKVVAKVLDFTKEELTTFLAETRATLDGMSERTHYSSVGLAIECSPVNLEKVISNVKERGISPNCIFIDKTILVSYVETKDSGVTDGLYNHISGTFSSLPKAGEKAIRAVLDVLKSFE